MIPPTPTGHGAPPRQTSSCAAYSELIAAVSVSRGLTLTFPDVDERPRTERGRCRHAGAEKGEKFFLQCGSRSAGANLTREARATHTYTTAAAAAALQQAIMVALAPREKRIRGKKRSARV